MNELLYGLVFLIIGYTLGYFIGMKQIKEAGQ